MSGKQDTESFLLVFYYTNASWGLVLICLVRIESVMVKDDERHYWLESRATS